MLPDTDLDGAMVIAERIRTRIERLAEDVTVPVDKLSASLGVSAHDATVETLEQLLDRADRALYVAKNGGRNRAIAFDAASMPGASDELSASPADGPGAAPAAEFERLLEQKWPGSRHAPDLRPRNGTAAPRGVRGARRAGDRRGGALGLLVRPVEARPA